MRVRVDQKADAIYVTLTDRAVDVSEEATEGIIVDYDAEGRIVGIEILDASKRSADPAALQSFSFEVPTVAA
jgi:YD repeat-containing protein